MTKVLLITGASSGIGAATARAAVQAGWTVGLLARSAERLAGLVGELGPEQALALPADVTSVEEQTRAVAALVGPQGDSKLAAAARTIRVVEPVAGARSSTTCPSIATPPALVSPRRQG